MMKRYSQILASLLALILFSPLSVRSQEEEEGIEQKRERVDATVFKTEALAAQYSDSIVAFWDEIREAENPLEVFRTYKLGNIESPKWTLNRRLPEKIFEFIHKAPSTGVEFLKSYQLQIMVNQFIEEGYALDQADFRHSGFELNPNGVAISEVTFQLNVSGPTHTLYRRSFRGVARVVWNREANEDGIHFPESISFEEFKLYRRTGKLGFIEREWFDGSETGSRYSYFVIEDYDLNGLPDVLFPRGNQVYLNVGDFNFDPRPLVKANPPSVIDSALLVDLDLDGEREYIICVRGIGIVVFEPHKKTGKFDLKPKTIWKPKTLFGGISMTVGDANGDGSPDLFVGQNIEPYIRGILPTSFYDTNDSLASFLLINQGGLRFRDSIEKSGVSEKMRRRNRASTIVDLNGDGLQDLLLTSNFSGIDVFSGSNSELFVDKALEWLPNGALLGSNQIVADFNRDGILDIFSGGRASFVGRRMSEMGSHREGFEESEAKRATTAKGSQLWLGNDAGEYTLYEDSELLSLAGSVWGSSELDFNNDGNPDMYLTNGYISKTTASDYDETFWRHDVYDSEEETKIDAAKYFITNGPANLIKDELVSWFPYEKNVLLANFGEEGLVDIAYLMGVSSEADGRATVAEDFNMDGKTDLLTVEIDSLEGEMKLKILENDLLQVGNWVGVQLKPAKKRSVIGAQVRVTGKDYVAVKANVFGGSRNAQTSSFLRFGIGDLEALSAIEITWADGEKTVIQAPEINRYHPIAPEA